MKNLQRFNEGMYADLSPAVTPIIVDFEKFLSDNEKAKEKFNSDLHAKEIARRNIVRAELSDLHKDYINVIKEIMVDVEDFLEEDKELYMLVLKRCWKFSYNCKATDYDKFIALQDKLDNILGPESYEVCYNTYQGSFGTGRYVTDRHSHVLELDKNALKDSLSKRPDSVINIDFLFKSLG